MATGFLNFDTKHAVCGSSKLKATTAGHLYNIKLEEDMDNGRVISKGDYISPETYKAAAAPTTFAAKVLDKAANGNWNVEVTEPAGALLVLQVPVIYEEYTTRMQHESNFYNASGDIVRAYELYAGDVFELSAEGFDGAVAKGDAVKVDTSSKKLKKNV